jgi:hypothetical protein
VQGNPDLGEASPRPPVEGRHPAPQTPLHKDRSVQIDLGVEAVIGCNLVLVYLGRNRSPANIELGADSIDNTALFPMPYPLAF